VELSIKFPAKYVNIKKYIQNKKMPKTSLSQTQNHTLFKKTTSVYLQPIGFTTSDPEQNVCGIAQF